MDRYPRSQQQHLHIQHVGSDTLIYDERRHRAFCLDPITSAVWQNSNGTRSIEEIAASARHELAQHVSENLVWHALVNLDVAGLLAAPAATLSRRSLLARGGATAALVVPMIATIAAPKAAQAYNGCLDCDAELAPVEEEEQKQAKPVRRVQPKPPTQPLSSSPEGSGIYPTLFKP